MAVIGISGSYGGLNTGDEAILASIVALWRGQRPDDKLVVFARDGEHTADHHDADAVVVRDVRLAQERGIPTFAYAVGAGPLKNPEDRQLVAETLMRMDGVTVRDEGAKRGKARGLS